MPMIARLRPEVFRGTCSGIVRRWEMATAMLPTTPIKIPLQMAFSRHRGLTKKRISNGETPEADGVRRRPTGGIGTTPSFND